MDQFKKQTKTKTNTKPSSEDLVTQKSSSSEATEPLVRNTSNTTPMDEDLPKNSQESRATGGSIDTDMEESLLQSDPETIVGEAPASNKPVIEKIAGEAPAPNKPVIDKSKWGGARRKRFYRYVEEGLDEAAAAEKSAIPIGPSELPPKKKGNKRNRSNASITPQAEKKSRTFAGAVPVLHAKKPQKFSDVLKAVKVGIVPAQFPDRKLSEADIRSMRMDVLKLIYEQRAGTVKPKFTQLASARSGWMIFHCVDSETANWLKSQEYWTTKECIALDEKDFPRQHVLKGLFKYNTEIETPFIFGMVEGQNEGLSTEDWRPIHREDNGHVVHLVFEVDDASMTVLRGRDLSIDFGYGQTIKLKIQTRGSGEEQSDPIKKPELDSTPKQSTSQGDGKAQAKPRHAPKDTSQSTSQGEVETGHTPGRPKQIKGARRETSKDVPVPSTPVTRLSTRLMGVEIPKTPVPKHHTKSQ